MAKKILKAIYWCVIYVGTFIMGAFIGLGAQRVADEIFE